MLSNAIDTRSFVASSIITAYTWLTAYEFWRGRKEQLVSRWPAIFMLFAHGSLFLLHTPLVTFLPWSPATADMFGSVWLTVLSFEALLFTISVAFILLAMAKERTELRHRTAAMVDPLTGIANRRAFLADAAVLAKRHNGHPRPATMLLIDLDHFKSINDRFGHAVGDRVLEIFTTCARRALRGSDLIGRLGGEEFAALIYDMDRVSTLGIAERIRDNFSQATDDVEGHEVLATVSIGVAHCDSAVLEISELLAQADRALYFAKERGRNRVEVASLEMLVAARDPGSALRPPRKKSAA
jgi:diguanylate cyclase (GGDEF)-like protein